MTEQKAPAPKKKAAPKQNTPETYKNVSKANIFTEAGRVAPNKTCILKPEQAAQYKGLELCQKNSEQSEEG